MLLKMREIWVVKRLRSRYFGLEGALVPLLVMLRAGFGKCVVLGNV